MRPLRRVEGGCVLEDGLEVLEERDAVEAHQVVEKLAQRVQVADERLGGRWEVCTLTAR